MNIMGINVFTIIACVVNVLVFYALMKHFFWDRISAIIEKRQSLVTTDLNEAKEQKEKAQELKASYEKTVATAKDEAEEIVEKARKQSKDEHDLAVKNTADETQRMIANAQNTIAAERSKSMKGMQQEIASIAMAAAQKVVSNNLDDSSNQKYLNEFLSEEGGK